MVNVQKPLRASVCDLYGLLEIANLSYTYFDKSNENVFMRKILISLIFEYYNISQKETVCICITIIQYLTFLYATMFISKMDFRYLHWSRICKCVF